MEKSKRCKYEYILDRNTGIQVSRWHGHNTVSIAKKCVVVMFFFSVKKFSQAKKELFQFMGGVDRRDQNIECPQGEMVFILFFAKYDSVICFNML